MSRLLRYVKALIASYFVTGILLLVLALILYKLDPQKGVLQAGIVVTYILSPFIGGLITGKGEERRHFLWGALFGVLYFAIFAVLALVFGQHFLEHGKAVLGIFTMCILGGMFGGMFH